MSIVIYPSLVCSFRGGINCPYCWVDTFEQRVGRTKPSSSSSWEIWRDFLLRLPPATIDVVGGEPLQYPGIVELLQSVSIRHCWAMTTHLPENRAYHSIADSPIAGCVHITWSYHPYSRQDATTFARFQRLRDIYGSHVVSASVVHYGNIPIQDILSRFADDGIYCAVNEYQPPVGNGLAPTWQRCNGGHRHIVCGPDGGVWPCFALFERPDRNRWRLGHISDFVLRPARALCHQECGPCYRAAGNPFRIDLAPCTDVDAQDLITNGIEAWI